jgi:hypothetical protein
MLVECPDKKVRGGDDQEYDERVTASFAGV